jgi:hypothetical protein
MWSLLVAACTGQPEPVPEIPPRETARVFSGWLQQIEPKEGQRWFTLDLLEESFAAVLDGEPLEYEKLSNLAGEGRRGWILEGTARGETLEGASSWGIRVLEMGEHYTDCHSDGPWPRYTGPVFAEGAVRFVAEDREPYDCPGSPDIVLRPSGAQVEVSSCGRSFLARAGDSLQRRYQAALDAWARAEIARLKLKQGSKPEHILHEGRELQCFPAALVGGPDQRPRLACDSIDPSTYHEVWVDTDGVARTTSLHNHCGWYAIEPDGH